MAPRARKIRTANDEFQLALSLLSNRKQRQRQRRFVVEGVRSINQALAHGWPVESFWYSAGAPLSRWARSVLETSRAGTHIELAPELMAALSGKEETSELLAIAEVLPDDLARIQPHDPALVVVFDRPAGPGNLGSVIRSADAFGADGVVVSGHAADVYDPQTVRASQGSLFAVPVVRRPSSADVVSWLRGLEPPPQLVGSSAGGATRLSALDLSGATALVIGNEAHGLSASWRAACDAVAVIPMHGSADSLNAAAAASILLYETDRQRREVVAGDASRSAETTTTDLLRGQARR